MVRYPLYLLSTFTVCLSALLSLADILLAQKVTLLKGNEKV